ncbi:retinol dehydrogenase 12-like [Neodiprion pinetum]|uniref:retinol dehydrogenase 12-like n=1 Tax=Neodiprion pinetum TaxID=441929 RepID=UPI001EE01C32|nr:retinol dehydrogenase 12-like [Neodiprion pinetum]
MWPFSSSCRSKARLTGKTVIITGANTGIGKETARDLYWRGAKVILACRNVDKANAAVEELKAVPPSDPKREQFIGGPGELVVCKLDLTSLASVREFARRVYETELFVDVLVNNAGVMMCPKGVTEDGFEIQFGTNHLGHFLLTLLLLPLMVPDRKDSDNRSRIINVSSAAHARGQLDFEDLMLEKSYAPFKAYCQRKLANVLFTRELTRRLRETDITGVNVYALHPGVIDSELARHFQQTISRGLRLVFGFFRTFIKSVEQGAQTTIHCAVDEAAAEQTGLYYSECAVRQPSPGALDYEKAAILWKESVKFVGLPSENLVEIMEHVTKEFRSPGTVDETDKLSQEPCTSE